MGAAFTELNTDFGELCDGVVDTILEEFDEAVKGTSGASGVLSSKRSELKRNMLRHLGDRWVFRYHLSVVLFMVCVILYSSCVSYLLHPASISSTLYWMHVWYFRRVSGLDHYADLACSCI